MESLVVGWESYLLGTEHMTHQIRDECATMVTNDCCPPFVLLLSRLCLPSISHGRPVVSSMPSYYLVSSSIILLIFPVMSLFQTVRTNKVSEHEFRAEAHAIMDCGRVLQLCPPVARNIPKFP